MLPKRYEQQQQWQRREEGGGGKEVQATTIVRDRGGVEKRQAQRLSHMTLLHCIESRPICEFCFKATALALFGVQQQAALCVACSTWLHIIKKYLRFTFRKDNDDSDDKQTETDDKRKSAAKH